MQVNLVEISGISDLIPTNVKNFKYIQLSRILNLPANRPNIERLLSITADTLINEKEVLYGSKSMSIAGQTLTGKSLIIKGNLKLTVEYLSDLDTQFPTIVDFANPFTAYIVLNENFDCDSDIIVDSYIHNIYFRHISKRKITTNSLVLLNIIN